MKTAQYGVRDNLLAPQWLSYLQRLARDSLPNPLVGPGLVEVFLVLLHCAM